ncbi:hypothetical protein M413DRAFT_443237 [Hebeloma cylindrosporum]|uniref:Uncharacterized protein n=1 Tax=Hebeloma cylindrosporum TaxID=76867 RepID=A0A0C3CJE8_HEBCY|nr:hypothetical protein M413DRAFT_443237 [Hebeloma cylindrosporum h7]
MDMTGTIRTPSEYSKAVSSGTLGSRRADSMPSVLDSRSRPHDSRRGGLKRGHIVDLAYSTSQSSETS